MFLYIIFTLSVLESMSILYFNNTEQILFFHFLPALLSLAQMINNLFQRPVVIPARQKGCDAISLGVALVNT